MQPPSFFILGRNPILSIAEIEAVLSQIDHQIEKTSKEVLILTAQQPIEFLMKQLGGTIKIGVIEGQNYEITKLRNCDFVEEIKKIITDKTATGKKIFFGLTVYGLEDNISLPSARDIQELGVKIKRELQEKGFKARFVACRERALSSVIVKKEKLLKQGVEIVLLFSSDGLRLGRTQAVQEWEEASRRDFGRPVREMKVGILPLQLAKIMINLAQQSLGATILDPFCGFGTILAEAALMGYQKLIGLDIRQEMIDATQQNLRWLQKQFPISNFQFPKLIQSSVIELSKHLLPQSIDAIITEPYLGPTKLMQNEKCKMQNLISELTNLYIDAFCEFKKILKPGGRVVFIFPVFKNGQQIIKTSDNCLPQIKKLGFEPIQLLPKTYNLKPKTSFVYSRPDQKVLREIIVLTKQPL